MTKSQGPYNIRRLATALLLFGLAVGWRAVAVADEVRVIDGDTIVVGAVHYRLHGIDAPEAGQTCTAKSGETWLCGHEATEALVKLVGSDEPICDGRGVDNYDRVIAVCVVGGVELNAIMVSHGLAWAFHRYSTDYAALEEAAREQGIGIWQAETETPWDYRERQWSFAAQVAPDGCPIKGNISGGGRIYHAPWSPWYAKTKVSLEQGEKWFCSEREALDAGWRAPIWGR